MTTQQLEQLADELLRVDIDQPSAILSDLSDDELETAFGEILNQFGLELVIGAYEKSEWVGGKLVIDANEGPISFVQTALFAVRLEKQRRRSNH